MKFQPRSIWNQPWAGNQAWKTKLRVRPPQNHRKFKKLENREKQPKNEGKFNFSMFKMHFRSADAANHLNAGPRAEIRVTRRAYIPKIYKLRE